jgi:hypothetical protein
MATVRSNIECMRGNMRSSRLATMAIVFLALSAAPLPAQTQAPAPSAMPAPPTGPPSGTSAAAAFEARVEEVTRAIVEKEPRLKRLPPQNRRALLEFVLGNMLFVSTHEMGHGVLAELQIPNVGRDEDAADSFATLTMLKIGRDFSHRVLVEAARGWYLADRRDKKQGETAAYYDEHGMNLQRAYQIVCLMVGSDPSKFKELADMTKMPEERQESCKTDFSTAVWSWETLLKPHLRAADQPRQEIQISYGEAKGPLEGYARAFRDIRFLETLAEYFGDRYAWPKPFVMVMESCGEVGANWRSRKLRICYEMVQDFAELYRDYGSALKSAKAKTKR